MERSLDLLEWRMAKGIIIPLVTSRHQTHDSPQDVFFTSRHQDHDSSQGEMVTSRHFLTSRHSDGVLQRDVTF